MDINSRTKNSIINSIYASGSQIVTLLLSFLVRTVFIRTLSAEYLGINGLFKNIITMLSLADLGIGISIPYTLYKPLAENNQNKIKALMKLYAKIYNVIGIVVLVIGIAIAPFLGFIIEDMPNIPNINLIYILFVMNSACSYFFTYKKILLDSDQKGYIASRITMMFSMAKSILEIIILYTTKNYLLYLIVSIITVLLQNIVTSIKCNKIYPYLQEKTVEKVSKEDVSELKKNTSALLIYRLGSVVLTGTDSIIISKYLSIALVGIYSNYLLITDAITNVVSKIFDAITASIGNLVVTTDSNKSEDILYKLQFLDFWLYTFFAVCVVVLINPFIRIWAGEQYVLDNFIAFAIGLNLYVYGMQGVVTSYRNAYGLFVQGKYRPIVMSIINIIVSIVLARKIGLLGVIIGTIISRLLIIGIYDPIIVFKHGLKKDVKQYFKQYIKYIAIFCAISIIFLFIVSKVNITNYLIWIVVALILAITINIVLFILFRKDKNLLFYKQKVIDLYENKIKKRKT